MEHDRLTIEDVQNARREMQNYRPPNLYIILDAEQADRVEWAGLHDACLDWLAGQCVVSTKPYTPAVDHGYEIPYVATKMTITWGESQ